MAAFKHLLQVIHVRQVDQCVNQLVEEVVCVNDKWILPMKELLWLVQPEELPDDLVEVEGLASALIDQTSQLVRVTHDRRY